MFHHAATPLALKDRSGSRHTRLHSVAWDKAAHVVLYLGNEAGPTGLWCCDPKTGQRTALTGPELNVARFWLVEDPIVRAVLACDPDLTEREQLFLLEHDGTLRPLAEADDTYHYFGGGLFDGMGFYVANTASQTRHRIMQADTSTGGSRELFATDAVLTPVLHLSPGRLLLLEEQTNIDRRLAIFDEASLALTTLAEGAGRIGQVGRAADDTVMFTGDLGGERIGLHTLNLDTGRVRTILERPGQDVQAFCLHPETGRIAVTLTRDCAADIVTITMDAADDVKNVTQSPVHVHSMCFVGEGDLLTVTSGPFTPPEAHVVALNKPPETPAACNAVPGVRTERVDRFPSFDGREIEFVVMGGEESGQAMIYLHGGPESLFERSHSAILEALVESGVMVIAPNIRGSEGYGRDFIGLDDGVKRLDALADVIALREHVRANYAPAAKGIGIMGHSYGGFMTLMAIAHHPDLWSCAVDIAGMSHLGNFLDTAPAWRRRLRAMEYGDPATHAEFFERIAPLNRAGDIRTPLLILHGDRDTRVPVSESAAMARALNAAGKCCKLQLIAGEGHFLTRRTSTEVAARAIVDFVGSHFPASDATREHRAHTHSGTEAP
jgi:dipeptidyl aminopeptidase/acylaminoacyl peptidase